MTVYDWLHSLLDHECLPFCVTDLVHISELVTSSASVVRWLTLHSWTLNYWTTFWIPLRMNPLNSRMSSLLELRKDQMAATTPNVLCFGLLSVEAETSEPLPSKWSYSS
jgi:hypothetical protein